MFFDRENIGNFRLPVNSFIIIYPVEILHGLEKLEKQHYKKFLKLLQMKKIMIENLPFSNRYC
jgi:hypothetical protein